MMANYPAMPQGDPTEQAIYWLTLLTSGEANAEHQQAFDHWLTEDSAHQIAWDGAQALWKNVSLLSETDIADILPTPQKNIPALRPRRFVFSHPGLSLAACILLTIIFRMNNFAWYLADYRTGTGSQQEINLADGSTIQLNTDTAISVDYSAATRRVTLHGGEAWFKVAPDPQRPFEVAAADGTIRALGTAFDVKNTDHLVTVTVYEHAVRVQLADGEKLDRLPEGSSLKYDQTLGNVESHANLAEAGAWHAQQMKFHDQKLHEVVKELNRYRKGGIFIADNTLNDLPLTGTFDTTNPDEALLMIQQSLGIADYRVTDRLVFLYRG
jgi:transmembrane sensor